MYHGDVRLGDTIDIKFTTRSFSTGAPTTLAGTPVISAYPGNSVTQITAGITLTVDFDAVTGLHNVRVVATSGNGYATATNYALVITTGTVGGVSVVGEVIGTFSIEARSALMPATAGRTAVVDAAGLVDANAVKVGPTGAGTAQTAGDIMADTNDIQSRLPAALVGGRMDASVGAMAANVLTAAATAADFGTEIAAAVWDALTSGMVTVGSIGKKLADWVVGTIDTYTGNTKQTGDAFARLGAPAGASVSADIAAIEAQTDDIGVAGAGLTAVPWNAAWDAEVQSEADDALVAQRLDELLNADSDIDGLAPPTVGSVFHELLTKAAASFTYDQATDSLEAIRDTAPLGTAMRGTDSAALASVCTEARLAELDAANLPTDVANVKTDTAAILVDTGTTLDGRIPAALVGGRMDSDIGAKTGNVALSAQEKADVNAEVVDAVNVDTIAELAQGIPTATPTMRQALMLQYMALRDKLDVDANFKEIHNDAGTVICKKALSDDGTTYSEAEMVAGP